MNVAQDILIEVDGEILYSTLTDTQVEVLIVLTDHEKQLTHTLGQGRTLIDMTTSFIYNQILNGTFKKEEVKKLTACIKDAMVEIEKK